MPETQLLQASIVSKAWSGISGLLPICRPLDNGNRDFERGGQHGC